MSFGLERVEADEAVEAGDSGRLVTKEAGGKAGEVARSQQTSAGTKIRTAGFDSLNEISDRNSAEIS